jgi:GxxExxY protein
VDENSIGNIVLGCAIRVHKVLGPGLLEGAYEACLAHEIAKAGLSCQRQLILPVVYDDQKIDLGYRLDILIEEQVVVEIKSIERLAASIARSFSAISGLVAIGWVRC